MREPFDFQLYSKEMANFIGKMRHVYDETDGRIIEYIKPLAKLLYVGRIEMALYERHELENGIPSNVIALYKDSNYDSQRFLFYREHISNGNVLHFKFYKLAGIHGYTNEEHERIAALENVIAMNVERCRMKGVIDYFLYNDHQLDVHNMSYFILGADKLYADGISSEFAVCYFDLRQFSLVNEFVGWDNGTRIMKKFIDEYKERFTNDLEIVCRVGGDDFVSIIRKEHLEEVISFMKGIKIVTDITAHDEIIISASVGVYMLSDEPVVATELIDRAAVANAASKNDRRNALAYFDEKMLHAEMNIKRIQAMFPNAVANNEFRAYYQPKVYLEDYSLAGAEALCRWFHDGKMITPDDFIPVFERKGLIPQLDFYMLEHVCMDIRRWIDESKNVVPVSVNLSRCNFVDKELFEHIMEIIDKYNIPHELIEIELTETTTDVDFYDLKNIVVKLKNEGICVVVDDFGVGYSSLNLIRELPWDILKLDKSLLDDRADDTHGGMVFSHIIDMADELGIRCIAEGVETIENVQLLKECNCPMAQGYYFDRPLPIEDFEKWLDGKKPE